ncbi:MAG: hypothetical protein IPM66_01905 [Acidobacteriota bacterium]|nr:MAG: hypothetical protein IPM66_01905 [Acidobacteriota bacterium]
MAGTLDQVSAETKQALIAQAEASGLSVDDYLKRLLGVANNIPQIISGSVEEFIQAMESLAEKDVQPLPRDFTREDIYFP